MISRFHVKNFRSIVDLNVSFLYDELKAPNGYKEWDSWPFLTDEKEKVPRGRVGTRFVPCMAIYGANASGKSNVIRALGCLDRFILKGFEKRLFQPNKLHPEMDECFFEVEFSFKGHFFRYYLSCHAEGFLEEALFVDKSEKPLFSIGRNGEYFFDALERDVYSVEKLRQIYSVECCDETGKIQKSTFLEKVGTRYSGLNVKVTLALRFWQESMRILGGNKFPLGWGMRTISEWDKNEGGTLFLRFNELVHQMDVGIQYINYKRIEKEFTEGEYEEGDGTTSEDFCSIYKTKDGVSYDVIHTFHTDFCGNEVKFNVREESEGTKVLFGLLAFILLALEEGHILVVDEIDKSLHPLIVRELVRLFKDKDYNKKGAQLIFTTHTTDLLDDGLMRVSEVAIMNKSIERGSVIQRISQVKDIRNVTNFRRRYLNGEFRGIPYSYI